MAYNAGTKVRTSTDYIAIHCSASATQDFSAADINRWHLKEGWACIGYHYVIKRDGTLEEGRHEQQIGAHVSGYNHNSLGICMVGGVNKEGKPFNNFTDEQFKTLELLLKHLKPKYPKAKIQGHNEFPKVAKACPSFPVQEWLKTVGL
jgi:N-acetylmuramoyl-L-alanine amidase